MFFDNDNNYNGGNDKGMVLSLRDVILTLPYPNWKGKETNLAQTDLPWHLLHLKLKSAQTIAVNAGLANIINARIQDFLEFSRIPCILIGIIKPLM